MNCTIHSEKEQNKKLNCLITKQNILVINKRLNNFYSKPFFSRMREATAILSIDSEKRRSNHKSV